MSLAVLPYVGGMSVSVNLAVTADRPARHETAVVFAADGLYARFALHAAAQIARLHPDRNFDVCLCGIDATAAPPDTLADLDVRMCRVETGDMFDGLRLDKGRSQVVYLRLALPEAFAKEYRRILYLDADIFIRSGDFAALLNAPLAGHAIAAVRDNSQWRTPGRLPRQFKRLGLPHAPYFNAGVMLIDVERWNAQKITERAIEIGIRHKSRMIRHDQNLLNAVLHGDWAELHPTWNWQFTRAANLFAGVMDPNLIHFIGPAKPWNHTGGTLPLRFRRTFRDFLGGHWPDEVDIGPDGAPPHRNRSFLRKSILRHLISMNRFCDYLDRFDDPAVPLPRSGE